MMLDNWPRLGGLVLVGAMSVAGVGSAYGATMGPAAFYDAELDFRVGLPGTVLEFGAPTFFWGQPGNPEQFGADDPNIVTDFDGGAGQVTPSEGVVEWIDLPSDKQPSGGSVPGGPSGQFPESGSTGIELASTTPLTVKGQADPDGFSNSVMLWTAEIFLSNATNQTIRMPIDIFIDLSATAGLGDCGGQMGGVLTICTRQEASVNFIFDIDYRPSNDPSEDIDVASGTRAIGPADSPFTRKGKTTVFVDLPAGSTARPLELTVGLTGRADVESIDIFVPLPTSAWLLLGGMGAFVALKRRKCVK